MRVWKSFFFSLVLIRSKCFWMSHWCAKQSTRFLNFPTVYDMPMPPCSGLECFEDKSDCCFSAWYPFNSRKKCGKTGAFWRERAVGWHQAGNERMTSSRCVECVTEGQTEIAGPTWKPEFCMNWRVRRIDLWDELTCEKKFTKKNRQTVL